jgi:hypothetical protein
MGLSLGFILSFDVIFPLLRNLDPLIGWSILGGIYITFSVILAFLIREPPDIEKNTDPICK